MRERYAYVLGLALVLCAAPSSANLPPQSHADMEAWEAEHVRVQSQAPEVQTTAWEKLDVRRESEGVKHQQQQKPQKRPAAANVNSAKPESSDPCPVMARTLKLPKEACPDIGAYLREKGAKHYAPGITNEPNATRVRRAIDVVEAMTPAERQVALVVADLKYSNLGLKSEAIAATKAASPVGALKPVTPNASWAAWDAGREQSRIPTDLVLAYAGSSRAGGKQDLAWGWSVSPETYFYTICEGGQRMDDPICLRAARIVRSRQ